MSDRKAGNWGGGGKNNSRGDNRPSGTLPEVGRPDRPMEGFEVKDAIAELRAAAADVGWFCTQMDLSEKTRLCWWPGKTGTGRKDDSRTSQAQPWPGAADHAVHLTQEIIYERNAGRVAALARGALSVKPTDGGDARKAALMKKVLRYYLHTAMNSQFVVGGLRAGSWADRFGHSILYVGWKEERAVERKRVTLGELVQVAVEQQMAMMQSVREAEGEAEGGGGLTADGADNAEGMAEEIVIQSEDLVLGMVLDPEREEVAAGLLLSSDEGLRARGVEGLAEAKRSLRELRKGYGERAAGVDPMGLSVSYVSSFVKHSAPCWEALRPFVDVFYPAETVFEDNLNSARWVARVKRLSAQQLREQAVIHDWDQDWVEEVIAKHRGKMGHFATGSAGADWFMNGMGTQWRTSGSQMQGRTYGAASQSLLFEIVELWDRSTTPDGLTGTYHTVLHADVNDKVAKRKLLEYWSGCYPFVAFTSEMDEVMLLDSRSLPERVKDDQNAVKAQWDSRTNIGSLTTVPPWTGPAEMRGTKIRPGQFVESYRTGEVTAFQLPPPDGRSIEIEKTIRASVDRRFGRMSETVPDALQMMMGQADMNWFLMGISQGVRLTAMLIQQYMPPLKGARITGTDDPFDATAEEVRGSYDFAVGFDVRSLDIEWAGEMLTFVKDLLVPLDRKAQIKTGPLLEFGFNILDPVLADASLEGEEEASDRERREAKASLTDIFSGGAGQDVFEGMDFDVRAQTMVDELKRSPLRQQMVATNGQIRSVYIGRLKQLVESQKQYTDNVVAGQQMGKVPLAPQSEAEMMLAELEGAGNVPAEGAGQGGEV